MSNPFSRVANPTNAREHQANANWATYERMAACETLAEYDAAGARAPQEVIANAHTAKWVEKELSRLARKARQS